jgi:hypothetical protein
MTTHGYLAPGAILDSSNTWLANQRFTTNTLLTFGTTDGTDADLFYNGSNLVLDVNSGDWNIIIAGGDMAFQQATAISTSAGALTLTPTTDVIVTNGKGLIIGHTAQVSSSGGLDASEVQILGNAEVDSSLTIGAWQANAGGPNIRFIKSRDPAIADGSFAIVVDGDTLGQILFLADDGTNYGSVSADITANIDGTPGEDDTPGRLLFRTTADGAQGVTERMRIDSAGSVFVGDTAHGAMTTGLVVNQSSSDNQILALKSSDVNTGLSTLPTGQDVEADDFLTISKIDDGSGGVRMQIMAETGYAAPFLLEAWGGDPTTTDTEDTMGCINIFGGYHNGSNADVDMQANASLLCIGEIDSDNNRKTRLLLKADDGELQLGNTTLVALDAEDDVQLVRAMQRVGSDGGLIESQYDNPFYDYQYLREKGLAGEMGNEGFFLFPLQSRLHAHEGAMWQTYIRVRQLEEKLELAERKLAAIGAA